MALIHIGFFSESLGMCAACDVILPQQSSRLIGMKTGDTGEKLKVLWLLHGASDNHTIWQRRTSIERYVAPLGLAVVMPCAHLSSYSDMAHGGKYFTYIADELPKIMRRFFNFSDKREDNFISGLSMGGSGCLKIGLARPEQYSAIGILSAGASNFRKAGFAGRPGMEKRQEMVYGSRVLEGTEEDTLGSAKKIIEQGLPAPRIYHACGSDDFVIEMAHKTRDWFSALPGNPFDYTFDEGEGAHTWEFWDEHIQTFLKFLKLDGVEGVTN